MLYTFSQAHYSEQELTTWLEQVNQQDAVVLWQDGVLLALKYPHLWQQAHCYALQQDVTARNLGELYAKNAPKVRCISLEDFISLTEQFFPQLAL